MEIQLIDPMTLVEARQCVDQIKRHMGDVRYLLLDLYEREGWKALGYESWRECATAEFEYGQAYVYRLLSAAQVERDISPQGEKTIPERYLRPLAKLETPEARREAWGQVNQTAQGEITVKHVEKAVTEWTYNQGVQYGAAGSTHQEPEPEDDPLTISIRAFELGVFMERFKGQIRGRYTSAKAAEEFGMSFSGAYRLLSRVGGSHRVSVTDEDGEFWIEDLLNAKDWPY